jgi:hypothetical protein
MPTKEQIEAIIKELQHILRIADWDIILHMKNDEEMDSVCKRDFIPAGYCTRYREYRLARIYLNYEADQYKDDWYSMLIHEVYHVVLDDFQYSCENLFDYIPEPAKKNLESDFDIQKEKAVCQLTKGFVNAYPVTKFDHILKSETYTTANYPLGV